jgi:probable F420-dependent oxidoreductase
MKIGLIPVNVAVPDVDAMIALARKAESVGLESVWTFEHAIVPNDYSSKYPYSADGKMGVTPETNFVDPLIALTAVAAETERLRLGTGVNILPQTNPLLLAKQAASLDFVSKGRFMLGVGIGWLREEFDAMGTPFERRGARFDDYVAAMRKVWSGETVEHESEHIDWSGFKSYPVPVQKPFPVVIGGSKGKVFERIARHGEGWFAPTVTADQLAPMLESLQKACAAEGRDPASVEISAMWIPAMGLDSLRQYEDLGVARLIVPVQALGGGNPIEALDQLASDVLAKL